MVRRRDCSLGCGLPRRSGRSCGPFRFGHVRQLDAVAARFVAGLARHAPIITAGEPISYLDIEDTVRSTFGYAKQGAGFGYTGVKGLNALLATVSSAFWAPVIVGTRLGKGIGRFGPRRRPAGRRRDHNQPGLRHRGPTGAAG